MTPNQSSYHTQKAMKQPIVSVIVPNYNYARYLTPRIESILQQTFTEFELILLDDASTDGSVPILETYRNNPHVSHLIVNSENTGSPFKQWMKGILLAQGKYVWIAEADDLAEPLFLETCVRLAEAYADTAICYTGSVLIDEQGATEKRDINHWGKRARKGHAYFDGPSFAAHNLYWKNYTVNASGILFRREYAVKLSQSEFLDMRYCGDWLFWFQMAMQGGVVEVYQNLNYFRQHMQKVTLESHHAGKGIEEDILVLQYMESRLPGLSTYKKRLRHGLVYRKIKRMHLKREDEQALYELTARTLCSTRADYRLERRNQVLRLLCPFLLTRKRDRLK